LVCNIPGKDCSICYLKFDGLFDKQILIEKNWVSLSTLGFIWASLSVFMLGSALLFLNWHFKCVDTSSKKKSINEEGINKILFKFLFISDIL